MQGTSALLLPLLIQGFIRKISCMEQELDKYEVNMTSVTKKAGPETLEYKKAGNTVDGNTFSSPVEELKPEDSVGAAPEDYEVELGRSVRWPGKLLEGDAGGTWVGISSPFPPKPPTDPLVKINPRILSPASGAMTSHRLPPSDISTHLDKSTSEVSDLPSLTSFKSPTPPFSSPAFPPRLPLATSNKVNSPFPVSMKYYLHTDTLLPH